MIIGQCFATPFTEDINCYHAHKIISDTAVEQIGFAESLVHIITLPSNHEIITQIDNDEIIIDDTAYNAAKKLVEYLLSQAKVTISNIKPIKKTSSDKGNCFRHGNEIGMITGQVRDGRKIGFVDEDKCKDSGEGCQNDVVRCSPQHADPDEDYEVDEPIPDYDDEPAPYNESAHGFVKKTVKPLLHLSLACKALLT